MATLQLSRMYTGRALFQVAAKAPRATKLRKVCAACTQSRLLHQDTRPTPKNLASLDPRASVNERTQNIANRPTSHSSFQNLSVQAKYSTMPAIAQEPIIDTIFETKTGTFQYVVADPSTKTAAIIDPVLDYDPVTQAITTGSADALISLVKEKGYKVEWILETHAHADHLTAASYLQSKLEELQGHRASIGIGKRIGQVQKLFGQRYGVPVDEYERAFDKLFDDNEVFKIGNLKATAMHLPGHTPDHLGYRIGDNVFCGDSIFHIDIGTARCDFPGGSVNALWNSAQKLLELPDHVKIWTGHDYPPNGRTEPVPWMTVKDHKAQNKHLKKGTKVEDFVAMRKERDGALAAPRLLHQSLQLNIRGGKLPTPAAFDLRLLHLPLKLKGVEW